MKKIIFLLWERPQSIKFDESVLFKIVWVKYTGMDEATIEDLAFGIRSSREPDGGGRHVCLSGASYADAEKGEWRMALKI